MKNIERRIDTMITPNPNMEMMPVTAKYIFCNKESLLCFKENVFFNLETPNIMLVGGHINANVDFWNILDEQFLISKRE